MSAPRPLPWWRTLAARMALLLAIVLPSYSWALGELNLLIQEWAGLGPRQVENIWHFHSDWVLESLLAQAEESTPGRWEPASQDVRIFAREQALVGELFAWLDTDGRLVASSDPFEGIAPGEPWPFRLDASSNTVELATPGREPVPFPATPLRIYRDDGTWLGTLVRVLAQADVHAQLDHGLRGDELPDSRDCEFFTPPDFLVMATYEYEQAEAESQRLSAALEVAVTLGLALLLGTIFALLVTRRLSRLARAAGGEGEHGVPGPFPAGGRDEIAALAAAMNTMRARVVEMVEHLAGRDARRREWVALVSHDLRTPLTALLACLDRAEAALATDDLGARREELVELVAVARLDADRVHALADDLLEIARLDARESLHVEPVPPGELLREAVRELGPMAQASDKRLEAEVDANLPVLDADGRRLLRALENLLRNALEHARSWVTAHVTTDAEGVRFEVRDDGPGLPEVAGEVQLRKLADRRGRADSAGLGLVVTRRVAEAHGGDIGAHNAPGGGAVVWFRLPWSREHASDHG